MRIASVLCCVAAGLVGCNTLFGVDELDFRVSGAGGAGAQGGEGAAGGASAGAGPGGAASGGAGGAEPAPWWDEGFSQRMRITFQPLGVDVVVSDFPVLVRLGAAQVDLTAVAPGGADLRFVDADGQPLDHELDHWSDAKGGAAWVRVPEVDVSSGADHLWLYYGNPAATVVSASPWPATFVTVHHFDTATFGVAKDSAGSLDVTLHGDATTAPGRFGNGLLLDGTGDFATVADDPRLGTVDGEQRTVSLWFQAAAVSHDQPLWIRESGCSGWTMGVSPEGSLSASLRTTASTCAAHVEHAVTTSGIDVRNGEDHHVALVVDRVANVITLYLDGEMVDSAPITDTSPANDGEAHLGFNPFGTNSLSGTIDELRVSDAARAAGWHFLEHANGRGSLLAYGPPEQQ